MKITGIDTFMSWVDWCNWLLVRISTDEGVCGWGEASLHGAIESVATAVREYGAQLIGQDPAGPEQHWHRLYNSWRWRGGAVFMSALSALDLAPVSYTHLPAHRPDAPPGAAIAIRCTR